MPTRGSEAGSGLVPLARAPGPKRISHYRAPSAFDKRDSCHSGNFLAND